MPVAYGFFAGGFGVDCLKGKRHFDEFFSIVHVYLGFGI
jgi:hypothetical protein